MSDRTGCEQCGLAFSEQHRRRFCSKCRRASLCGCGGTKHHKAKQCRSCYQPDVGTYSPTYKGGKTRHRKGYVMERVGSKYVFQHVLVMQEILGRDLRPGENVHHVNGIRDDNRPENLELWTRPQPTGVRVADAVEHAVETLRLYAPDRLA